MMAEAFQWQMQVLFEEALKLKCNTDVNILAPINHLLFLGGKNKDL